jgi:hypothetical protein
LWKRSNFAGVAHDIRIVRRISNYADHLGMIRITGYDNIPAVFGSAFSQMLNSGNEGAGGVYDFRGPSFQVTLNLRRYTVSANYRDRVGIGLAWFVDRRNAQLAQSLHLLSVVNQGSQRANRTYAFIERIFNHFDGAFDAKTESEFFS